MKNPMQHEFSRLLKTLSELDPETDEYAKMLEKFQGFAEVAKPYFKEDKSFFERFLDNPALVGVVGNLLGMFMVLTYERAEIITTRAINFIRPK